jgi:hypothetical protein
MGPLLWMFSYLGIQTFEWKYLQNCITLESCPVITFCSLASSDVRVGSGDTKIMKNFISCHTASTNICCDVLYRLQSSCETRSKANEILFSWISTTHIQVGLYWFRCCYLKLVWWASDVRKWRVLYLGWCCAEGWSYDVYFLYIIVSCILLVY